MISSCPGYLSIIDIKTETLDQHSKSASQHFPSVDKILVAIKKIKYYQTKI